MGIATTREDERILAINGLNDFVPSKFEYNESVLNAGVLFSLPALLSQGMDKAFKVFRPLPSGFYGLHHIILILCFMTLCRIKNPEQLKKHSPGELGKLLGLDRIPQVEHFRTKLKQITSQSKTDELHTALFQSWVEEMPEMFFYIDGHVLVYNGDQANLPKRFVSREKLCLSGTTEFWINDQKGLPLMVITGELNEKLKAAIELAIPQIKNSINLPQKTGEPLFTLVFDREAYEPDWFVHLWKKHRVAVITYRKNVKDKWDESLFNNTDVQVYNTDVSMRICEMGTKIGDNWFRKIRKLSEGGGHQTSIITTHPTLGIQQVATKMFSRWTQENYFKYMAENFDFDRMIEYGVEPVNQKLTIPNPEYKRLTYELKKSREKKSRLEARLLKKLEVFEQQTDGDIRKKMAKNYSLMEQISIFDDEIKALLQKRKSVPSRMTVADMPEDIRYNRLKQEGKKLKNAIVMIAYRAESSLYNILSEFYKSTYKDGREVLKEIFTTDADLIPNYENRKLIVRLHSLSTPRANEAIKKLCEFLNDTKTVFPYTNLTLIYETLAV